MNNIENILEEKLIKTMDLFKKQKAGELAIAGITTIYKNIIDPYKQGKPFNVELLVNIVEQIKSDIEDVV